MSGRTTISVKVNAGVWEEFRKFVVEAHGSKHGNLGRELENALSEYMDHDRQARLEDDHDEIVNRLDSIEEALGSGGAAHTHTNTSGSETVEKTREIVARLQANYDHSLSEDDVERAIEDIAGGDERTVEKYKRQLKRRGHAFEHPVPQSAVWFLDVDGWFEVLVNQDVQFRRQFFSEYPDEYWEQYRGRCEFEQGVVDD